MKVFNHALFTQGIYAEFTTVQEQGCAGSLWTSGHFKAKN